MRNAVISEYERVPRQVVVICNDFSAGYEIAEHHHHRAQLVYAAAGTMVVGTEDGRWAVPADRAVWIPAGVRHDLRMVGAVTTVTFWVETNPALVLPSSCHVVGMSGLMRTLLSEAVEIVPEYEEEGRDGTVMKLLLQELVRLPTLPVGLRLPAEKRLAERCRTFLQNPKPHDTIEQWCEALGVSRRTFTRLFKRETGVSFATWRQQACLFAVLPRLATGESITRIAFDLGYESPSAFTTMFKRLQGVPPSVYTSQSKASHPNYIPALARSRKN